MKIPAIDLFEVALHWSRVQMEGNVVDMVFGLLNDTRETLPQQFILL